MCEWPQGRRGWRVLCRFAGSGPATAIVGLIPSQPPVQSDIVSTLQDDPHNLARFLEAQEPVFAQVLEELREGHKTSHWMWFVFPQLRGLGHSSTASYYGILSLEEAKAYLNHPVLGPRLRECCRLVNLIEDTPIQDIFGYPDYLKFRSSITLFAQTTPDNQVFTEALAKYFNGEPDLLTLERL